MTGVVVEKRVFLERFFQRGRFGTATFLAPNLAKLSNRKRGLGRLLFRDKAVLYSDRNLKTTVRFALARYGFLELGKILEYGFAIVAGKREVDVGAVCGQGH